MGVALRYLVGVVFICALGGCSFFASDEPEPVEEKQSVKEPYQIHPTAPDAATQFAAQSPSESKVEEKSDRAAQHDEDEENFDHLGRWHDGPRQLELWYVCEQANQGDCPSGWQSFRQSCYAISETLEDYDQAAISCRELGAHLVNIQSQNENDFVQSLCDRRSCWIGLSEPPESENWFWPNGAAAGTKGNWAGFTNWDLGEPNNHDGNDEDVTFMNFWGHLGMPFPRSPNHAEKHLGKWHDGPRDMTIWYVCEKPLGLRCSNGWAAFEGSCYTIPDDMKPYDQATSACKALSAHLVTIASGAENDHVVSLAGERACWLGLSEPENSEEWRWSNGQSVGSAKHWTGYTNWDKGEPNNHGGRDEDATFMNYWGHFDLPFPQNENTIQEHLGKWYDVGRTMPAWYICEKPAAQEACEAEGWSSFKGACYVRSHDVKNYDDAALSCQQWGAQLVTIESADENAHVLELTERKTCWIGLAEPAESEVWFWANGTKAGVKGNWSGYTNWDGDEPNNWDGHDEDGAIINLWLLTGMREPWRE